MREGTDEYLSFKIFYDIKYYLKQPGAGIADSVCSKLVLKVDRSKPFYLV